MLIGKKNLADNHLLSSVAIFNKIGLLVNLIPFVIFLALFGISGFFNSAIAASSTRSPATATSADTYCTKGDESCWQDIDKVYVSDGQTAGSFYTAEYLIAKNFGFSIPSNATINGITAEIQRRESSTSNNCVDSHVYLTKIGDTAVGSNKANAGEWPTSFAYVTYGSSSDLWGSSWTYSEVNSSNFGLMINLSGGVSYCLIDHIRITVTYTTNTAPTITGNPSPSYISYTRTGPVNTPFSVHFTATDSEQTGLNALTYYIHTGANRTGTQLASGTFTSGGASVNIAYNTSPLSQGSNPLYLSVYDGAVYSSTNPSFTVYRDDTNPSASGISHNPNPVTSTNQYTTTFTVNDTYSTNGGEQRWWVRTASGGGGTQLASGTATAGNQVTTGTITTDTALTNGASRYIRLCDGANNCSDTSFTVVKSSAPTISSPTQTNKTSSSITLGGNITSQGGSAVDVRGVCYAITTTNANPEHGGTGVTCANHASGGTGIFTVDVTGLSASEGYSYKAFAHNTQGYAYTSADTFTTLTNAPISVTTNNESELGSYKVRFHGTANPNGSQAYGYFRVFPSVPDCTINSGGTRIPSNPNYDFDLGEGNSPVNFDIPTPSTINLTRDTDYWYCAYAWNEEAGVGSPATSASSGYDDFHTTDGPASGCDAPASGNMTVTESCSFPQTDYDGVDSGGNTSGNSAALILGSGGLVTLLPGQVIGVGSKSFQGGAFLIGNGSAGVILGGGVWLKDADNDGYIDSPVTKIISRNQPAGYKRRNYVYTLPAYNTTSFNYASKIYNAATTASTYLDCDETNGYIYREVANLVTDADNDGYKTSAASNTQCVGTQSTINGRTYFKDASNNSSFMLASQVQGGGATDCQDDPNGAPCAPTTVNASNASSQTQNSVTWSGTDTGGAVPAGTGFDLKWCTGAACTPNSSAILNVSSGYTHSFSANPSTIYRYAIAGKNANGTGTYSTAIGQTTTASSCTNTTVYSDNDGDGYGSSGVVTQGFTTSGTTDGGSSVTINKPVDIVSGMFVIIGVEYSGGSNRTVSVSGGSTWNLGGTANNGTSVGVKFFWKYAGASEPSSYTINLGTTGDAHAWMTSFANVAASNPIGTVSTAGTGVGSSHIAPAITPTGANYMLITMAGTHVDGGKYSPPTGMKELYNKAVSNVDTTGAFYEWITSASPTGTRTATYYSDQNYIAMQFELKRNYTTSNQCIPPTPGGWSTNNLDCDDNTSSYYQYIAGYKDEDNDTKGTFPESYITSSTTNNSGSMSQVTVSNATSWSSSGGYMFANLGMYGTNYLKYTNFGFNIPSNATITGIEAFLNGYEHRVVAVGEESYESYPPLLNLQIDLVINGNIDSRSIHDGGQDMSLAYPYDSQADYLARYGKYYNLVGQNITYSDINSSQFGIAVRKPGRQIYFLGSGNPYIKSVSLKVYYSTGGSSACSGGSLRTGYVANATDCYDGSALAYPGSSTMYSSDRGDGRFDYDCDGDQQKQFPNACTYGRNCLGALVSVYIKNPSNTCVNAGYFSSCTDINCHDGSEASCGDGYMIPKYTSSNCSSQDRFTTPQYLSDYSPSLLCN